MSESEANKSSTDSSSGSKVERPGADPQQKRSDNSTLHAHQDGTTVSPQIELSMTRTALSLDRTLLAWIRTSLALIGFGFTLAKYIHVFITKGALAGLNIHSPRTIGIMMMLLGVAGISGGIIQYYTTVRRLRHVASVSPWSPVMVMAIALALAGFFLTLAIVFKLRMF